MKNINAFRIRVLIIEDDEEDYFLICDLLNGVEGTSYVIEWVKDPDVAVQVILNQAADVYLMDHRLGKRTGLEILAELKKTNIQKPIILLTGQADHKLDMAAMESGASDFLPKIRLTGELLERSIRYSIKRCEDLEKLKDAEKSNVEREAAEAANKSKSQFLATMSHEIRTPLTAILGYAHLGRDSKTSVQDCRKYMEIIENNGEHLLALINDILDLSKIEAGQMQITPENCQWQNGLAEVVNLMESRALEKELSLRVECEAGIPDTIRIDCQRVRQILFNIIGNAVKFTDKGEVLVRVSQTRIEGNAQLRISIADTGIGISESEKKKLFQLFSQADSNRSRKYGGTGLGLNISKRLAKALGGDLVLEKSEPGVGSTFVLTLPLVKADKFTEVKPRIIQKLEQSGKGLRILLAEDSFDNQALVKMFLTSVGFEVETANNGVEAVEKALNGNFDTVLMDIEMPEMDGYEATGSLRAQNYKKPIVALTAHAFAHASGHAGHAGFSGYIIKPIRRDKLVSSVLEVIASTAEECQRT